MEDHYVTVQGYKTRYWAEGNGPAVLLVHGMGASADTWLATIGPLSQHYRVLVPDIIGFGYSDKPVDEREYTVARAARFLAGFLDSQDVQQAHVVGNSLGGLIALQFTIDFPHRVQKLVLADSAGFGQNLHWSFRLQTLPLIGELLSRPSRRLVRMVLEAASYRHDFITDEMIDRFYRVGLQPGNTPALLRAIRSGIDLRGIKPQVLAAVQERIPSVTAPTLVIWGRHDQMLPIAHMERARQLMPTARFQVLADCWHIPQMECAGEFNRLVMAFLAEPAAPVEKAPAGAAGQIV